MILGQREVFTAVAAIRSGRALPQSLEDKASALGTNAQTLLEAQSRALGFDLPTGPDPSSVSQYTTDRAAVTTTSNPVGEPSAYDTGKVVGQVSVDGARKAIVGKESGNNFQAVNPHSGAPRLCPGHARERWPLVTRNPWTVYQPAGVPPEPRFADGHHQWKAREILRTGIS